MEQKIYSQIQPLGTPSEIFNLKDRVGLIMGGGGKMGQQFAQVLSLSGSHVILSDINKTHLESVAADMFKITKKQIDCFECDVTQEHQVEALFEFIANQYGHLDYLICNMMGKPEGYYKSFEKYPKDTFAKVLEINLTGSFLCCQKAAPLMEKQGGGSIVLTSSTYGMVGPDQRIYKDCLPGKNPYESQDILCAPGAYSASKGGIISLTKYLATLLGGNQIRVNTLTPGGVYDGQEALFHKAYIDRTPLERMAVWSDYNGAILFLVSDASRYMTGANLVIDGGWTAW